LDLELEYQGDDEKEARKMDELLPGVQLGERLVLDVAT